jgi:hypothetical protein
MHVNFGVIMLSKVNNPLGVEIEATCCLESSSKFPNSK